MHPDFLIILLYISQTLAAIMCEAIPRSRRCDMRLRVDPVRHAVPAGPATFWGIASGCRRVVRAVVGKPAKSPGERDGGGSAMPGTNESGEPIERLYLPRYATYVLRQNGIDTVEALLSLDVTRLGEFASRAGLTEADLRVLVRMLRQRPQPHASRHAPVRGRKRGSAGEAAAGETEGQRALHRPSDMGELMLSRLNDLIVRESISAKQVAGVLMRAKEAAAAAAPSDEEEPE